jgi:hypothetical protein
MCEIIPCAHNSARPALIKQPSVSDLEYALKDHATLCDRLPEALDVVTLCPARLATIDSVYP